MKKEFFIFYYFFLTFVLGFSVKQVFTKIKNCIFYYREIVILYIIVTLFQAFDFTQNHLFQPKLIPSFLFRRLIHPCLMACWRCELQHRIFKKIDFCISTFFIFIKQTLTKIQNSKYQIDQICTNLLFQKTNPQNSFT